jgi:hypothetical protein
MSRVMHQSGSSKRRIENREEALTAVRVDVSGDKAISASDGRMTASPEVALGEDNEQPRAGEKDHDH